MESISSDRDIYVWWKFFNVLRPFPSCYAFQQTFEINLHQPWLESSTHSSEHYVWHVWTSRSAHNAQESGLPGSSHDWQRFILQCLSAGTADQLEKDFDTGEHGFKKTVILDRKHIVVCELHWHLPITSGELFKGHMTICKYSSISKYTVPFLLVNKSWWAVTSQMFFWMFEIVAS